jgi:hypothetical protein
MKATTTSSSKRKAPVKHKKATRHAAKRARERLPVGGRSSHGTTEDPRNEFSEEEWHDMVATAAYFRAEARGFEADSTEEDWYEAEAELRERFSIGDNRIETPSNSGGGATNIETTGE